MTETAAPASGERRQYFRAMGTVYLRIERGSPLKEHWLSQAMSPAVQESLDAVSLKLMNYRSRLHYEQPEVRQYLLELAGIVEELHRTLVHRHSFPDDVRRAYKRSVIISGSGLEFLTDEGFDVGEEVTLEITFPEYPYATVMTPAAVTRVEAYGSDRKKFRVCLLYGDIQETDRECIIRYVNHLQTQKRKMAR